MKRILALLFIMTISNFGYTQTQNVAIATEPKTIQYTNGREVFNICKANQTVTYKEDLEYYWYNEFSKVKSTKGGAGGNLLHGKCQFFDEKGNLTNEANFYLGLKDGFEKTWDADGNIKETYKYSKGKLIYSKFKSENSDNIIEWNGPILLTGSVKKVYTSYGHLEKTEEMLEDFKIKVTVFFYDGKVKKKYTTGPIDWMYDEYVEYYENGKIKFYGMYEENWRIGDWKWYKEDGSVEAIEKYRINRQYSPDNKIMTEGGEYFDTDSNEWIRNGLWIWYKENGKDWEKIREYEFGLEESSNEEASFSEVTIGKQVWMTENLKVDKFRNGEPIPQAKTNEEWKKAGENKQPAWCYYANDPANEAKYGKLYNWYAVNDPRGLAPKGWHIPSNKEWYELTDYFGGRGAGTNYLGGSGAAGAKMKSTSSGGFLGLPGGYRYDNGSFKEIGENGYWWSSTEEYSLWAIYRYLYYVLGVVDRAKGNKEMGLSVRCLRD